MEPVSALEAAIAALKAGMAATSEPEPELTLTEFEMEATAPPSAPETDEAEEAEEAEQTGGDALLAAEQCVLGQEWRGAHQWRGLSRLRAGAYQWRVA